MFHNSTLKLIIHAITPVVQKDAIEIGPKRRGRPREEAIKLVIKLALMISKSIIELANKISVDLNWVDIKRARYSVVSSDERDLHVS